METRETLIAGLRRTVYLLQTTENLENERNKVRTQYMSPLMMFPFWKTKKMVLIALGFGYLIWGALLNPLFMSLFGSGKLYLSALIIGIGLGFLPARLIRKKAEQSIAQKNQFRASQNAQIEAHNQATMAAEQAVIDQIQQVRSQYEQEISPWYPSDYCYLEAANFFLSALQNYRADTLKEVVNLYEDTLYKNRIEQSQLRMEQSQQELVRQQKIGNILAVGNLVMQAGIQGAVNRNTQAVNSAASQNAQAISNAANQASQAINRNTNAVKDAYQFLRKKL